MRLFSPIERILSNQLVRSIAALASGTALGQLLMILAMPLLTRLYTPEEFSVMALYVSLVSVLSVSAALRFDIAVPIAKEDAEAEDLVWLGLLFGGLVFLLLALVSALIYLNVSSASRWWLGIAPYIWLIPIGVFFSSAYGTLQMWGSRRRRFNLIARTRLAQGGGMVATQLGWGVASSGALGLVLGQAISHIIGVISLFRLFISSFRPVACSELLGRLKYTATKYSNFPKYSTFEALFNNGGIQVPVVLISLWAIGAEAGYVLLAMQLMQAPMSLLGAAIGQVFFPYASTSPTPGDLDQLTRTTLINLIRLSVIPLIVIGTLAPLLFPFVFGKEWARAGVIVAWMVPWFIMQMLVSPLSMILHICRKQREALLIQIVGFFLRVGVIVLAALFNKAVMAEAYAISGFVFYSIYLWMILRCLPSYPKCNAEIRFLSKNILIGLAVSGILYCIVQALLNIF